MEKDKWYMIGLGVALILLAALLARAYPVAGITLDGGLSDWPADFVSYPIDTPRDAAAFEGSFRAGYNLAENSLYLAVKVRDESMVRDGEDQVNLVYPGNRDACPPLIHFDQEKVQTATAFNWVE